MRSLCWDGDSQNDMVAVLHIAVLRYWYLPAIRVLKSPDIGPWDALRICWVIGFFKLFIILADWRSWSDSDCSLDAKFICTKRLSISAPSISGWSICCYIPCCDPICEQYIAPRTTASLRYPLLYPFWNGSFISFASSEKSSFYLFSLISPSKFVLWLKLFVFCSF